MVVSTPPTSSAPPPRTSRVIGRFPFFYGWVILAAGMLGIIMMGPSQTFTVSVFIDSFVADLGISRGNVSLLYGIATLAGSFLLPITGRMVDRYGNRLLMVIVVAAFGVSMSSLALVNGPWSLLLIMLAVRFLGFGSMQLVSNNLIAQWFVRRRGFVMGISGQSLAISLLLFPALADFLITQLGWRMAWVALGALTLLTMLPIGWLFFRDRPELYGLLPDGDRAGSPLSAELAGEVHWTLAEARRTGIFWLFAAAIAVFSMILAGMVFHQTSLFAVRGLDRSVAVFAFQVTAFTSIVGNLGTGYLLDRISPRQVLALQLATLVACMLLVQSMTAPWQAMLYATLWGMTSGAFRVVDATVWAKYFGRRHLGAIRGATMIGTVGGAALGPYPLGLSYDLTGSYAPALTLLLVLPAAIAVLSFVVKRPAGKPA